jgi:hypothetical protein
MVPVEYEDIKANGTVGLLLLGSDVATQALEGGDERFPELGESFVKAVDLGDGHTLVYQQDFRGANRMVVCAPVVDSPGGLRLARLDLGVDLDANTTNRPAVQHEPCTLGFRGAGADFHKACLQGGCSSDCEGQWAYRHDRVRLTDCTCGDLP